MSEENKKNSTVQMMVAGILVDPATQAPVIILKNEEHNLQLPIWIGMAEATSIASYLKKLVLNRPLTHDLFISVLENLSVVVEQVLITELKNSTYYAEIVLSHGEKAIVLDCRPSDAIAVAIRSNSPIYVNDSVIQAAKESTGNVKIPQNINPPSEQTEQNKEAQVEGEESSSELDDLKYVDKSKWAEILKDLDIKDFKYKA
jgi:bifunctional DNase/RNase